MQPIIWLFFALGMTVLGYRWRHLDEVHSMALYSVGLLSGIWGFSLVPSAVQITVGALVIGWLQIGTFRN